MAGSSAFSYRPSTISIGTALPPQNVPMSVKFGSAWQRQNMDYFDYQSSLNYDRKLHMLENYRYLNNDIDQEREYSDYSDILGLGKKAKEEYGKTAKIEHFPICIRPFHTILGEFIRRPMNFYVRNENAEARNEYYRVKGELLFEGVMAQIRKRVEMKVAQQYPDFEPNTDEYEQAIAQLTPEKIQEYVDKDYVDSCEQVANRILRNLWKTQQLDDVFLEGFKHGVANSETYYHVFLVNGKTRIVDVSPMDVFYHKSPSTRWVHKSQYAGYRLYLTPASILDMFYDKLTHADMEKIYYYINPGNQNKKGIGKNNGSQITYDTQTYKDFNGHLNDKYRTDEVQEAIAAHWSGQGAYQGMEHYGLMRTIIAYWRSSYPLKFVFDPVSDEPWIADENYKINKELGEWSKDLPMEQIYQGVKIHDDIYLGVEPLVDYPLDMDNLEDLPLPIFGCVYNDTHAKPISTVDLMRPWNKMYDILADSLKKDMNSALGKVVLMSMDHLPNIPGFSKEKWLYWLRELRVMFIKHPKNGTAATFNQFTSIDMSFAEQMQAKMNILERLKMECDAIAGFSPNRIAGSGPTNNTLGESRQQLISSVNQTEYLFFKHSQLVEHVLNYAINLSKVAVKKYGFLRNMFDDMDLAYIDADADKYAIAKLGVYLSNSVADMERIQKMEQNLSFAVQNGADVVDIFDLQLAQTQSEIRNIMERLRRQRKEGAAAEAKQKQAEADLKKYEIDTKAQIEREKMASNEEINYMRTFGMQEDNMKDTDENNIADVLEYDKFMEERMDAAEKRSLAKRKQFMDEYFKKEELNLENKALNVKQEEIRTNFKIAKTNKN